MQRGAILDFASPDALGLAADPRIAAAVRRGCTADARARLARELEAMLGRPATAVRGAHTVTSSLAAAGWRPGDIAVVEASAPRCWLNGIRLAGAETATFPRHDLAALDRLLGRQRSRPLVVVEAVSSLDGDVAELHALVDACDAHGAGLIVDESHGAFALGPHGGGATEMLGQSRRVPVVAGTVCAAAGWAAGFVSAQGTGCDHGPAAEAELPHSHLAGLLTTVRIAIDESDRRERLTASAAYFRAALQTMGLDTGPSSTHVIPILIRGRDACATLAERLIARGLALTAVAATAAPDGVSRLRVTVSSAHTRAQMDRALSIIEEVVARPLR